MFILDSYSDQPSLSSSPRAMTLELPDHLDQMSLKRKRAFEADEVSVAVLSRMNSTDLNSSLNALSSPHIPLPTPALSFSSSLHDDSLKPQAHPLQRNFSSDSRASKRLHITPRPRLYRQLSQPSSEFSSFVSLASPTTNPCQSCHICQRRPSTIQDLPAWGDCGSCNKRVCFICMRTCEGPRCQSTLQSHIGLGLNSELIMTGKRICSKCCVEVGSEGTVWCTTCYEDDTEPESNKGTKEQLQVESEGRVAEWLSRFAGPEADLNMEDNFFSD